MFRMAMIRTLDDVKRMRPETLLPGEREPVWLRRQAEYARELPLLMAEQRAKAPDEKPGLLGRLLVALGR